MAGRPLRLGEVVALVAFLTPRKVAAAVPAPGTVQVPGEGHRPVEEAQGKTK